MIVTRLVAGIGALAVAMAAPAVGAEAQHGESAITCTNVGQRRELADQGRLRQGHRGFQSGPHQRRARFRGMTRATAATTRLTANPAKLTVIVASSTGGYSLYHRCKLEQ